MKKYYLEPKPGEEITPRQLADAVMRAVVDAQRDNLKPEAMYVHLDERAFFHLFMSCKLIKWEDAYTYGIDDPISFSVDGKFVICGIPVKREDPIRRR